MAEPVIGVIDDPAWAVRLFNEVAGPSSTAFSSDSGGVLVLHHADVERLAHHPDLAGTASPSSTSWVSTTDRFAAGTAR